MMENRLGLLFGQIADSIRSGLGDTGTLRPNAFPAKIDDIVSLIGTGGKPGGEGTGSVGPLTFASGSFPLIEDGQRVTIEHGLGVMPDLIIVQVSNYLNFSTYEEAAQMQAMMAAWGMRSAFGTGNHSGYTSTVWGLNTTYGIDNMPEKEQTYGYLFCPDEATFQVGSTIAVGKLYAKTHYRWLAVSGIGAALTQPVLEPLNVTENGTYEAPEGVDGFAPVTVAVPAPEIRLQEKTVTENGEVTADSGFDGLGKVTVEVAGSETPGADLLPRRTIDNFAGTPDFGGLYAGGISFELSGIEPFAIEVGKTYWVEWDGAEYEVVGQDVSTAISNGVAIGNGSGFGFSGNGEPFAIIGIPNIGLNFVSLDSQESAHTVRIFKKANGFILAEPLQTSGTFRPTADTHTFNHNLGVVPDCVMIRNVNANDNTAPTGAILYAIGYRTGLKFSSALQDIIANGGNGIQWISNATGIEATGKTYCEFKSANSESVTVGGSLAKMDTTAEYAFVATRITA